MVHLSKTVCWIFHSQFRLGFIKPHSFFQNKNNRKASDIEVAARSLKISWSSPEIDLETNFLNF